MSPVGWKMTVKMKKNKKCVENTADNKQLLQNTSYCLLRNMTLSFALSLPVGDECQDQSDHAGTGHQGEVTVIA